MMDVAVANGLLSVNEDVTEMAAENIEGMLSLAVMVPIDMPKNGIVIAHGDEVNADFGELDTRMMV